MMWRAAGSVRISVGADSTSHPDSLATESACCWFCLYVCDSWSLFACFSNSKQRNRFVEQRVQCACRHAQQMRRYMRSIPRCKLSPMLSILAILRAGPMRPL
eukprot:553582-Rhodomonas_salina.2